MPENLISLTFEWQFNQKINVNTFPENLTILTFGYYFNQKIDSEMLPSNLQNINFDLVCFSYYRLQKHYIEIVNNIPNYYHVKILLRNNNFDIRKLKWPIHVVNYVEHKWSPEIYEIQDKYIHPIYDSITILIEKESYQPYSSAKSAQ